MRRHDGQSYELTGPGPVTFDEVAEILSTVLAHPVGFVPVPDDAAVAALIDTGAPEWFATNLVAQFGLLRQGTRRGHRPRPGTDRARTPHGRRVPPGPRRRLRRTAPGARAVGGEEIPP